MCGAWGSLARCKQAVLFGASSEVPHHVSRLPKLPHLQSKVLMFWPPHLLPTAAAAPAVQEESNEFGGTFICNGIERIIRMLVQVGCRAASLPGPHAAWLSAGLLAPPSRRTGRAADDASLSSIAWRCHQAPNKRPLLARRTGGTTSWRCGEARTTSAAPPSLTWPP